jgi:hypothetical protein
MSSSLILFPELLGKVEVMHGSLIRCQFLAGMGPHREIEVIVRLAMMSALLSGTQVLTTTHGLEGHRVMTLALVKRCTMMVHVRLIVRVVRGRLEGLSHRCHGESFVWVPGIWRCAVHGMKIVIWCVGELPGQCRIERSWFGVRGCCWWHRCGG